MENEALKAKIAEIDKKIEVEKAGLENETKRYLKNIQELEHIKSVIKHVPAEVMAMEWTVSSYTPYKADALLNFRGGDLEYAALFDAGFEFPDKPCFNEYNQTFYRRGSLTINDPLNGDMVIEVNVGNIEKPPSCKLVKTKKRKTVETVIAICEESGESL